MHQSAWRLPFPRSPHIGAEWIESYSYFSHTCPPFVSAHRCGVDRKIILCIGIIIIWKSPHIGAEWIERNKRDSRQYKRRSPHIGAEWIEIIVFGSGAESRASPHIGAEWIEIGNDITMLEYRPSLRT